MRPMTTLLTMRVREGTGDDERPQESTRFDEAADVTPSAGRSLGLHPGVACRRSGADPDSHLPVTRLHVTLTRTGGGSDPAYPLPTNGIFVAMTVMNWTFAVNGRLAMYTTALATCSTSISGSIAT